MVMGMANLAMATGNIGRDGVGVNPLRGQNNVQGSCDMGSFPHELSGYRHVSDDAVRAHCSRPLWGVTLEPEPGLRIPNMFDAAIDGTLQGPLRPGRGHRPVRPQHPARHGRAASDGVRRRPGPVPQRDGQLRPCLPARHLVPREGRHLHQRRAPHQPRAPGDAAASRGMAEWEVALPSSSTAMGYPMHYDARRPRSWTRSPALTPDLRRASASTSSTELGSVQWPCNDEAPEGTPIMHVGRLRPRQGPVHDHRVRADRRAHRPALPAAAHHRPHPQPVQCRRPDPAHRQCASGTTRTCWRSTPTTPRTAASRDGDRGLAGQPRRRDHPARRRSPSACRRASSTPPSTTR